MLGGPTEMHIKVLVTWWSLIKCQCSSFSLLPYMQVMPTCVVRLLGNILVIVSLGCCVIILAPTAITVTLGQAKLMGKFSHASSSVPNAYPKIRIKEQWNQTALYLALDTEETFRNTRRRWELQNHPILSVAYIRVWSCFTGHPQRFLNSWIL